MKPTIKNTCTALVMGLAFSHTYIFSANYAYGQEEDPYFAKEKKAIKTLAELTKQSRTLQMNKEVQLELMVKTLSKALQRQANPQHHPAVTDLIKQGGFSGKEAEEMQKALEQIKGINPSASKEEVDALLTNGKLQVEKFKKQAQLARDKFNASKARLGAAMNFRGDSPQLAQKWQQLSQAQRQSLAQRISKYNPEINPAINGNWQVFSQSVLPLAEGTKEHALWSPALIEAFASEKSTKAFLGNQMNDAFIDVATDAANKAFAGDQFAQNMISTAAMTGNPYAIAGAIAFVVVLELLKMIFGGGDGDGTDSSGNGPGATPGIENGGGPPNPKPNSNKKVDLTALKQGDVQYSQNPRGWQRYEFSKGNDLWTVEFGNIRYDGKGKTFKELAGNKQLLIEAVKIKSCNPKNKTLQLEINNTIYEVRKDPQNPRYFIANQPKPIE